MARKGRPGNERRRGGTLASDIINLAGKGGTDLGD